MDITSSEEDNTNTAQGQHAVEGAVETPPPAEPPVGPGAPPMSPVTLMRAFLNGEVPHDDFHLQQMIDIFMQVDGELPNVDDGSEFAPPTPDYPSSAYQREVHRLQMLEHDRVMQIAQQQGQIAAADADFLVQMQNEMLAELDPGLADAYL